MTPRQMWAVVDPHFSFRVTRAQIPGETPLVLAIRRREGRWEKTAIALLNAGANPNATGAASSRAIVCALVWFLS